MNCARVVEPGVGFRSLADVPNEGRFALDARFLHPDFEGEWVEAKVQKLDGEPTRVVAVVSDVNGDGKAAYTIYDHRSFRRIADDQRTIGEAA